MGDTLADMPLVLEPQKGVDVPLEATYNAAFAEVPWRRRQVLEARSSPNKSLRLLFILSSHELG